MSLNNYKLKNIPMGKIEVCPTYKSVIDIDDIRFPKRNYGATELETLNFLTPVSVLQHKDGYMLISGLSTFMAYIENTEPYIKARLVTVAFQQEKMLCVLHDIMSLIRLLPFSAKRRNLLKDQFYTYIRKNHDAIKAFSLVNNDMNSFSKILMHYDKPYQSAHFEHKKKRISKFQFRLKAKWFQFDADIIYFEFVDGTLTGLSIDKNGFTQKLIFEQKSNNTFDAKADYATDRILFRFRIIPHAVYLSNSENLLIYFDDTAIYSEEVMFRENRIGNIRLEVKPRSSGGFFLTENSTVKYQISDIDSKLTIKCPNSNNSKIMRKYPFVALPAE